jgi:tetratricopeptide (TPR) repeat protein
VSGFVVCEACGTRIKAGREYCLRCREPLPHPDAPVRTPLWVSLGLTDGQRLILGVVVALAVVALLVVIWRTEQGPLDDLARPAGLAAGTAANAPAALASAPVSSDVSAGADAPAVQPAPAGPNRDRESPVDPELQLARDAFEQQLATRPNDAETLNKLGQLLERMGRPDEAAARFERAVALAPRNSDYRLNLARTASGLGQLDRAIDQYREAHRLLPNEYATQYMLALTLQKKGDDQAAITEFERARRLGPKEPGVALALGASFEKVGRTADAVREYQRFIKMQPKSADAEPVKARLARLSAAQR